MRCFYILSPHKVLVAFFCVLHSAIVVWFFLGELKSCIILKFVTVSVDYCWRWLPCWLLILIIKKIPLDMRHKCMGPNYGVVKSPSDARCVMIKASCVRCVDTSVPRWEIIIWLLDINFHTLCIQDSVCSHCLVYV